MLKTFSGVAACQVESELQAFIDLLVAHGVRRYLEIGSRHGDTFHEVMRHLPAGSVGVAVDLPDSAWGMPKTRASLESAVADLVSMGFSASAVFGDSRTPATRAIVAGRGPFDAILIDGDHTLEGVTADWMNYGELAPVVGFHDIADTMRTNRRGERIDVPKFWSALKSTTVGSNRRFLEFVGPGSTMGIGVVVKC